MAPKLLITLNRDVENLPINTIEAITQALSAGTGIENVQVYMADKKNMAAWGAAPDQGCALLKYSGFQPTKLKILHEHFFLLPNHNISLCGIIVKMTQYILNHPLQ